MSDLLPRGFRFSHKDKSLLAKLVGNYPAILYKGLDAESLSKKMTAWEELTKQFNVKNNGHEFTFTPRHLKALWKRMKVQSKKAAAAQGVDRTNGSPLPELPAPNLEVMPMLLSEAEKITPDESSSPYIVSNDPPSPVSYVLPDDPPTLLNASDIYSCTGKSGIEDSYSPIPSPLPPSGNSLSRFLLNGDKKRRKPVDVEISNLHEEHRLRMECLRLDKEIKLLKKWKLEQEILSTGYELPPHNYS
ncbi:myb_DNA-bind_5 domain-containing protein [Nephila pilipes]|uniref:Regulatory protein zeste n=1 Tax=Nephila pilipes TaxID=299642 RepID=A0A8X6N8I1_NEPPI|nr:myb_DNA-bind_5 domain-containing protein [Nephila pilipes]